MELIRTLKHLDRKSDNQRLAFSNGGRFLVVVDSNLKVYVWDLRMGKRRRTLDLLKCDREKEPSCLGYIQEFIVSPDWPFLGIEIFKRSSRKTDFYSSHQYTQLWNLRTGELHYQLEGYCLRAFSPDGQLLATSTNDGTMQFWYLPTGELRRTLTAIKSEVLSIVFSANGNILASLHSFNESGFQQLQINIWDFLSEKILHSFEAFAVESMMPNLALSPDGKILVCSGLAEILFWDLQTGETLPETETDRYPHVIPLLDGNLFCTTNYSDAVASFVDIYSGSQGRLKFHLGGLWSISPNGSIIAEYIKGEGIGIWDVTDSEIE
ncbi:MAG TPA: hypothetical protein V6C95_17025 [Coleofasciculaceae cyanobacterium]